MSLSELTTHPNRYTNLFSTTQTTQILYPQHRKKIAEATQTTYFNQWQEYSYLTFSTNTKLTT